MHFLSKGEGGDGIIICKYQTKAGQVQNQTSYLVSGVLVTELRYFNSFSFLLYHIYLFYGQILIPICSYFWKLSHCFCISTSLYLQFNLSFYFTTLHSGLSNIPGLNSLCRNPNSTAHLPSFDSSLKCGMRIHNILALELNLLPNQHHVKNTLKIGCHLEKSVWLIWLPLQQVLYAC